MKRRKIPNPTQEEIDRATAAFEIRNAACHCARPSPAVPVGDAWCCTRCYGERRPWRIQRIRGRSRRIPAGPLGYPYDWRVGKFMLALPVHAKVDGADRPLLFDGGGVCVRAGCPHAGRRGLG